MKKIYLLQRKEPVGPSDETAGYVIVATSRERAVRLAIIDAWGERGNWMYDPDQVTVKCIGHATKYMPDGIVLRDYRAA